MSGVPLYELINQNYGVNTSEVGNDIDVANLLSSFFLFPSYETTLFLRPDETYWTLKELIGDLPSHKSRARVAGYFQNGTQVFQLYTESRYADFFQ